MNCDFLIPFRPICKSLKLKHHNMFPLTFITVLLGNRDLLPYETIFHFLDGIST